MFDGKTVLVSLLTFSGVVRLLGFGFIIYSLIYFSIFSVSVFALLSLSFLYVVFPFFGVVSALKERFCGLKLFSIFQTIFVLLSVLSLVYFVVTKFLHPPTASDQLADPSLNLYLHKFSGGSLPINEVPQPQNAPHTKKGCTLPLEVIIAISGFIFVTIIDALTAVLAWKGYKQLSTTSSPVQTYVSENALELNDIPVQTPPQPQPLNVVYIPLGESVQTGRHPIYQV